MKHIPLVRAKYAHTFAVVLDRIGAPTGRMLDRVGLSSQILEDAEMIVPAHRMWSFIASAAEKEGIHDFGIQAGRLSIEAYGEFSRNLIQAPNLNHAVEAFCRLARCEYSRADFYISRLQSGTWFCRGPIDGSELERKHVELLVVMMMIATIQLFAGPDWQPAELYLQTRDPRGVGNHEILATDIHFHSEMTAFEIPSHLLSQRIPRIPPACNDVSYAPVEDDFLNALRHIIAAWPTRSDLKIDHIAELVGVSRRTLQRRLKEAETYFSSLVEEVRIDKAKRMLAHSTMSLCDIALDLRYSDQANFTRAFRRWTAISPQTYRHQRLTDKGNSAG